MTAATGLEIGSWIAGILVALGVVIGWITGVGRRVLAWLQRRIRRGPQIPRTRATIEPFPQGCFWSQAPASAGSPASHVAVEMNCVVTNLGPRHALQIVNVDFEGLTGERQLTVVSSFDQRLQVAIFNPTLQPHDPRELKCIVVVERDPLPDGMLLRGQMVLRDQYGNVHKSPRNGRFRDARSWAPSSSPSAQTVDEVGDR